MTNLPMIDPETPEWWAARVGRITASRLPTLMKRLKNGEPAADAKDLILDIAIERITGTATPHFVTFAMQRGRDQEDEMFDLYAMEAEKTLDRGGFVVCPDHPNVGATPDRLIRGEPGLVEGKVPQNRIKHLAQLRWAYEQDERAAAHEYRWQAHCQLWCMPEMQWVDVISYAPEWPPHLRIAPVRLHRDEKAIDEIKACVEWAEKEIEQVMEVMK